MIHLRHEDAPTGTLRARLKRSGAVAVLAALATPCVVIPLLHGPSIVGALLAGLGVTVMAASVFRAVRSPG